MVVPLLSLCDHKRIAMIIKAKYADRFKNMGLPSSWEFLTLLCLNVYPAKSRSKHKTPNTALQFGGNNRELGRSIVSDSSILTVGCFILIGIDSYSGYWFFLYSLLVSASNISWLYWFSYSLSPNTKHKTWLLTKELILPQKKEIIMYSWDLFF